MTARIWGLVLLAISSVYAAECYIDNSILSAIANTENDPKREPGYPYIISFNDMSLAQNIRQNILPDATWTSRRTLDCEFLEKCVAITDTLVKNGFNNIDLGGFQINHKWFKYPLEDYFIHERAASRVCEILFEKKKRYGWSWSVLARYHSGTPKYNTEYQKKLKNNILTVDN